MSDGERGVILQARTSGPWPLETISAIAKRDAGGIEGIVAGFLWEHREGMEVIRGTQMGIGARRFDWNLAAGTATLQPPAPFIGGATFARGPGRNPSWTGSLRLPILGGRPIDLTGPRLRAHLRSGAPDL